MGACTDLSAAKLSEQSALDLLQELMNSQNAILARFEEMDDPFSVDLARRINGALEKMEMYTLRTQLLYQNIVELTRRSRTIMHRLQSVIRESPT